MKSLELDMLATKSSSTGNRWHLDLVEISQYAVRRRQKTLVSFKLRVIRNVHLDGFFLFWGGRNTCSLGVIWKSAPSTPDPADSSSFYIVGLLNSDGLGRMEQSAGAQTGETKEREGAERNWWITDHIAENDVCFYFPPLAPPPLSLGLVNRINAGGVGGGEEDLKLFGQSSLAAFNTSCTILLENPS